VQGGFELESTGGTTLSCAHFHEDLLAPRRGYGAE